MKCPYCETENRVGNQFCEECGAQLIAAADAIPDDGAKPQTAVLTPGAHLQHGRYVITRALGEGGMGSVWLAQDTRLANKPMVIKALSAESSDPEKLQEDVRNFKREAETLAHLDHPLIPDVTDHFEEGMRYYMVMDYVEGESLNHWLERTKKPMPQEDALRYGLEVLDILQYLSNQQPAIVHRDIKPENLIIGARDKHIHLVDFGIARTKVMVDGKLRKTTALGTPGYAPPEQYQGYADPRSDLYALAATLHHMLTNRDPGQYPPFVFPPVRTLNPQLSPQLEQVLNKALKTNAADRYQTPQEMRQDLESILAGTSLAGSTDEYTLTNSRPARKLPPRTIDTTRISSNRLAQAAEQARQQQTPGTAYSDPDFYQDIPSRIEQPRPIFQPQTFRPYIQPRQQWSASNYRSDQSRQQQENQLMWYFITFIVAICIIGLLAYLLFSSLHF